MNYDFRDYPDREMLAMDLANQIAGELRAALAHQERAAIAVPGGRAREPPRFLAAAPPACPAGRWLQPSEAPAPAEASSSGSSFRLPPSAEPPSAGPSPRAPLPAGRELSVETRIWRRDKSVVKIRQRNKIRAQK